MHGKIQQKFVVFWIALLCICLYSRSLTGEFLSWDDDFNIVNNQLLRSGNIGALWGQAYYGLYIPVTYTVWGLLMGDPGAPLGPMRFHILNLLLHVLNCILVYGILFEIFLRRTSLDAKLSQRAAWIGALLFACHPLQVNTVAWISGMRDLLSASFGLGATLLFIRSRKLSGLALVFFLLGILAKPALIALPIGLLVLDVFINDERLRSAFKKMLPLMALALPIVLITKWIQSDEQFTHWIPSWRLRPWTALDALGFYFSKIIWPWHLAVDYGRTPEWVHAHLRSALNSLAVLTLIVVGLALTKKRLGRIPIAGVLWSVAMLSPVMGIMPFAFQAISTVSDHYMYLPLLGWALACAALLSKLKPKYFIPVCAVLVLTLSVRTLVRVEAWTTQQAFFETWRRDNPNSTKGYTGAAGIAFTNGDLVQAENLYRQALVVMPNNPVALSNLGQVLFRENRPQEIVHEFGAKLDDPEFMRANHTRGPYLKAVYLSYAQALELTANIDKALDNYKKAQILAPNDEWIQAKIAGLHR